MQRFEFWTVYNIVGGTLLWEEEGLPLRLLFFESRFSSIVIVMETKSCALKV